MRMMKEKGTDPFSRQFMGAFLLESVRTSINAGICYFDEMRENLAPFRQALSAVGIPQA